MTAEMKPASSRAPDDDGANPVRRILDVTAVAAPFRDEVAGRIRDEGLAIKAVGIIADDAPKPCRTYARYTASACEAVGIEFELRSAPRLDVEDEIQRANEDPGVHGVIVYYPVFGGGRDLYIKEIVDDTKDLEGLGAQWSYNLYHDVRWVDVERTKKSILPCTPLAIVKILEHVGVYDERPPPLAGVEVTIVNRSEVVGRPLAAMLHHDGARIHSVDIDGCLLMDHVGTHECELGLEETLPSADVVIVGVPDPDWRLPIEQLKPGVVVINFSAYAIVPPAVTERARVFCKGPGKVTVAMALRNLLRLYDNFHAGRA